MSGVQFPLSAPVYAPNGATPGAAILRIIGVDALVSAKPAKSEDMDRRRLEVSTGYVSMQDETQEDWCKDVHGFPLSLIHSINRTNQFLDFI